MDQDEKNKLQAWMEEASSTWNFIHWETRFETEEKPSEHGETTQTLKLKAA